MSGETEANESGWTTDTLRAHVMALREDDLRALAAALVGQEKAVAAALASQQRAVDAALIAAKEANQIQAEEVRVWRVAQNEWRGAMSDREAKFMPREEALAIVASNAARFIALHEALDRRLSDVVKELDKLDKRMDLAQGRSAGISAGWGILIGAVGLIATVITIIAVVVGTR